jgi:outer membrane protein assembly factor BamA
LDPLTLRAPLRSVLLALMLAAMTVSAARAQNPFLSDRGQRTVSAIEFHGHVITKEYVLRRAAQVQVGDPYSSTLIPEIRERLDALPFIAYVDIESRHQGPGKMALIIEVVEDSRFRWASGARYERRNDAWLADLAVGMVNLTGRAESLTLHGSLYAKRGLDLSWTNPHMLGDVDLGVEVSAHVVQYDWIYEDFDFRSWGVQAGAWHDFDRWVRLRADLRWNEIKAFNGDPALEVAPSRFGGLVGQDTALRLSLVHDSRDQRFYPYRGLYLSAEETIANSATGDGYAITELDVRGFYPVRYLGIVAGRTRFRIADSDLPFYELSYLGGPMSLRGIDFGTVRGDQSYLSTIEVRRPIFVLALREGRSIGLGVHAFHDWGQAYDRGASLSDLKPRWDYGGGFHFNFGARNFRFEWARTDANESIFVFEDRFTF